MKIILIEIHDNFYYFLPVFNFWNIRNENSIL